VCLSLAAFPHYCTDPDVTWEMIGVPPSCALLGGFAIGTRLSLLYDNSAEREMSASACTRSVPGSSIGRGSQFNGDSHWKIKTSYASQLTPLRCWLKCWLILCTWVKVVCASSYT